MTMSYEELNKKIEAEIRKDSQLVQLENNLSHIEKVIGYPFNNKALLIQSFTRSSYAVEHGYPSNEVLEFFGDKIIDAVVVKFIALKFGYFMPSEEKNFNFFSILTNKDEGDFTEIKKKLVCNENLASIIDLFKFNELMLIGQSDIDNNVRNEMKVKADLLESIVGAIAQDSDWNNQVLEKVCDKLLSINIFLGQYTLEDNQEISFDLDNSINVLKELSEHGKCTTPIYVFGDNPTLDDNGNTVWTCACYIRSNNILVSAYAPNKKLAKKAVAYQALCLLFKVKNQYL